MGALQLSTPYVTDNLVSVIALGLFNTLTVVATQLSGVCDWRHVHFVPTRRLSPYAVATNRNILCLSFNKDSVQAVFVGRRYPVSTELGPLPLENFVSLSISSFRAGRF